MSLALIPLCQACGRPLAWPTIVEACFRCEAEALTERSLRVPLKAKR